MSIQQQQESGVSPRKAANTSSPRYFYIGMALLLMFIAFVGFWPSYFGPILRGDEMTMRLPEMINPWIIHLHVIVFMGWLAALLVQAILIARKKVGTHMKLGRFGVLVVPVGLLVLVMSNVIKIAEFEQATLDLKRGTLCVACAWSSKRHCEDVHHRVMRKCLEVKSEQ